jgi:tetratricopeptide (TPR) repeat protein
MKYITVFGNCQGKAISRFLKIGLPQNEYEVNYFVNNSALGKMKSVEEIIRDIKKSDILIYQPLGEMHGQLSENNIKQIVRKETQLVSFVYVFNSGMYSLDYYYIDQNNPGIAYGEDRIIPLLKEYDLNKVIQLYQNHLIDFDLINRFQICIAETQRRESQTDIRLSDFILDNYQKCKLFITNNHPTTKVFLEICSQIKQLTHIPFSYCSIDIENENLMDLPIGNTPISPYDIRTHGYNFGYHQDWFTQGVHLIRAIANNNKSEKEKEIDIINNLMKSEQFEKVEEALSQAIEKYPDSLDLVALRGELLFHRGNLKEAERIFTNIVNSNPNHIAALNGLACIKILETKWSEALNLLQSVLLLDPNCVDARENMNFLKSIQKDLG